MTRTYCSLRLPHFSLIFGLVYYSTTFIMKLAQSLALIITGSASFVIPFALASGLHLGVVQIPHAYAFVTACPASHYDCSCFKDGTNGAMVTFVGQSFPPPAGPDISFSINSGLCGLGKLDSYSNSDGNWDIYEHKGNGTVLATCYPTTSNILTCDHGTEVNDKLICYGTSNSNICNP